MQIKCKKYYGTQKMSNTFGTLFKITTFGESHGRAIGGIIDGCPAGIIITEDTIQEALQRRKPGQSEYTTTRKEDDKVELLSGVFEGKTLGTPIGFVIQNLDARSGDYDLLKEVYRPSHADYTYDVKYGHRDFRGGGRSSARATACVVAAGAIAKQVVLQCTRQIKYTAPEVAVWVNQIGNLKANPASAPIYQEDVYTSTLRCPDEKAEQAMVDLIKEVKAKGDSLGGIISGEFRNIKAGLGEPLFNKFQSALAQAIFSINAVHGFEYGLGFEYANHYGSEVNDAFVMEDERVVTKTNYSGGIQGGITNGMTITFNVAFKPTATIGAKQQTINAAHEELELKATGRHDACVLPRAVSIVEAFCWLVLADFILLRRTNRVEDI